MKVLALVLFCVASVFSQSVQDRVNKFDKPKTYAVEYDKFAKVTEVNIDTRIRSSAKRGSAFLDIQISMQIADSGKVDFVAFLIRPSDRYYLYNHTPLRCLLDGQLLDVGETDIDYTPAVMISPEHFKQIAAAKKVELQLGLFEGKVDDKTLVRLKNLASLAN